MNKEFLSILGQMEREKGLDRSILIDAVKQAFVQRGYTLTRIVQTFDYDYNGEKKKLKLIMWKVNKPIY